MKTRMDLLVRDTLAELFVHAAAGAGEARTTIAALRDWATSGGPVTESLVALRMETGEPLFDEDGAPRGLEPYIRDRAVRYAAALDWLAAEAAGDDVLEQARAAWDAGLFFEVHEVLEPVWLQAKDREREQLQGLIMAGAALHHLTGGNLAGARGLLRDASRRLMAGEPHPLLDLAAFGRQLAALAERVERGELATLPAPAEIPVLRRR